MMVPILLYDLGVTGKFSKQCKYWSLSSVRIKYKQGYKPYDLL